MANLWKRYAQKLLSIILLQCELIAFRFAYGIDRKLRFSRLLFFWSPWEPLFVDLNVQITSQNLWKTQIAFERFLGNLGLDFLI